MPLFSFAKRFRRGQTEPRRASSTIITEHQSITVTTLLPRVTVTSPSAPQLSPLNSVLSHSTLFHVQADDTENEHGSILTTPDNKPSQSSQFTDQSNRLSGVSWLSISVTDEADDAVTEARELEINQAKTKYSSFMEASLQLSHCQANLKDTNEVTYDNQSPNEVFEGANHPTIQKSNSISVIKHILNDVSSSIEDIKVNATNLIAQETVMVDSKVATTSRRQSTIKHPHIKKEVDENEGSQDSQQPSSCPSKQDHKIEEAKEQKIDLQKLSRKPVAHSPVIKLEDTSADATAEPAISLPQSILTSHESLMCALVHIHKNATLALNELHDVMKLLDE